MISERICARISWSCFAHAVESRLHGQHAVQERDRLRVRGGLFAGHLGPRAHDVFARQLRVPARLAGEVGEHIAELRGIAAGRERCVLVVVRAPPPLAERPRRRLETAQPQVRRDRLGDLARSRRRMPRPAVRSRQASATSRMRPPSTRTTCARSGSGTSSSTAAVTMTCS